MAEELIISRLDDLPLDRFAEAVARAYGKFARLRLRADDEGPARLNESLGFRPCRDIPDCTNIMEWCD